MLFRFSSFSLFITSIILFSLLSSVHGRWHHHAKKHKQHSHHHNNHFITISQSPSPSLEPSNPPDNDGGRSPSPSLEPSSPPDTDDGRSPSPSLEPSSPPDNNDGGSTSFNNSTDNIFDVRRFGAIGDGTADDTTAFKTAWDTACQSDHDDDDDNNTVVILVPYDFSFLIQSTIFTGPCKNDVVLQVDGTLVAPDGPDAWPKGYSAHQWLVFYRVYNMSLRGNGLVDGRGQKWWDLPCKPHKGGNGRTKSGPCDSPIAIRFFMSSNLRVEGLRIKDSPQFHFRFDNCKDVYIDSLHITAPALSPNTDGIHIENTNGVQIYNSVVANGDDCISIGSGSYNVDIRNMTCGPGHGISIGSLGNHNSRACVSNITVRDSIIKVSDNGVRIKTWQGGFGAVRGVSFNNIHMDNVRNPIIIDQFYCLNKGCQNQSSAVLVSDITYNDIKGTYDIRSPPMHFGCSDSMPCANLTLADIELLPAKGEIVLDPFCWNAYGNLQTLTIPPVVCLLESSTRSILESEKDYCQPI